MARVDSMTTEDTSLYERGYQEGSAGRSASPDEGYSVHYWQGFVMGRLIKGWDKAVETRSRETTDVIL